MNRKVARVGLGLLGLGFAVLLGHEWGTNDQPLWRDLVSLVITITIFFVLSAFVEGALKAIHRNDDDDPEADQ